MGFSISEAWAATQGIVRTRLGDLALPAAAFIFLPQFVVALYGPEPETMAEALALVASPWTLLANLIALLGQLAIIDLSLRPSLSVGGAIKRAARLWPLGLVITFLFGLALAAGFIALVLPGLFLLGRLLLAVPAYVARGGGVADAFRTGWDITGGTVWLKLLGAVLLLLVAGVVLVSVLALPGAIVEGGEPGLLTALLTSAGATLLTVYVAVFQAASYRLLAGGRERTVTS